MLEACFPLPNKTINALHGFSVKHAILFIEEFIQNKRQSLNSSLFYHGLIRILLVHHLKLQGDDWDTFLSHNGFVTSNPTKVPMVDKPMLEKPPIPFSDRPILLSKETCDRDTLDEPMLEQ